MKIILLILPLLAGLAPTLALAQDGCQHGQRQTQLSCAEGQVWDAKAMRCVILGS